MGMFELITVVESSTAQRLDYEQAKYQEFLRYYLGTDLKMNEIFDLMGLHSKSALTKYIRKRLVDEGYNSLERVWRIRKGELI